MRCRCLTVSALLLLSLQRALARAPLNGTARVCFVSGDPLLIPSSRGTAAAFTNLAALLLDAGHHVHAIVVSDSHEVCLASMHALVNELPGATATCAFVNGAPQHVAPATVAKHLKWLSVRCTVLVTHEWWSPLLSLQTARLLPDAGDAPYVVTNVHGGAYWSATWENVTSRRYAVWQEDYSELMGTALSEAVVFPCNYMRDFHYSRFHFPGVQATIANIDALAVEGAPISRPQLVTGLVYVGSVEQRKGIHLLLASLRGVSLARVEVHIIGTLGLVHGMGAREYIMRELATMRHVDATIHDPMPAAALWEYVKAKSLLLVGPSLLENQPTTIIYAARLGVPTLFFNTGGVNEMLSPESRAHVVIEPDTALLAARLQAILSRRSGHVPVLNEAQVNARAVWTRFLQTALGASAPSRPKGLTAPYADLPLDKGMTTDAIGSRLKGLGAAQQALLLRHGGYAVVDGEEAYLRALAAQLHDTAAGGAASAFTGIVRWKNGRNLAPSGPYFFPSSNWRNCGLEAPLLVRRSVLAAYVESHKHMPFRLWLFTTWLIYGQHRIVLRVPRPLFSFSLCIDSLSCFMSDDLVEEPTALLAMPAVASLWAAPVQGMRSKAALFHANYSALLYQICNGTKDPNWMVSASRPAMCGRAASVKQVHALKLSLLSNCGAFCVPNIGSHRTGWALDSAQRCWSPVISSENGCMVWFEKQRQERVIPNGVACV